MNSARIIPTVVADIILNQEVGGGGGGGSDGWANVEKDFNARRYIYFPSMFTLKCFVLFVTLMPKLRDMSKALRLRIFFTFLFFFKHFMEGLKFSRVLFF